MRYDYFLMNKDRLVAEFNIGSGETVIWGKLPYGFTSILEWIGLRSKFSCVRDVKSFFSSIGINSNKDFIEVTHCISLNDTFWVKASDSDMQWKDISPFRHNYSDVISTYALEGVNLGNIDKGYFTPVISTDGSFPHTWKYTEEGIFFIKAGSKYTLGGSNSGREPYSEYYASRVAEYLGFNHVDYRIRNHTRHDGRIDCVTDCLCYTSEEFGSVPVYRLGLNTYEDVLEYSRGLSKESFETCLNMLFLDCLLLNTDRHFSNIEFLVGNDTLKIKSIAPIYDNNYALLPRFLEGYDEFIRKDYACRDGRSFEELFSLVRGYKSFNKELISLKKFKFDKPEKVSIDDKRLKFLNDFLQMQVDYLLRLN